MITMKTHANRENDKQGRKERGSSTCDMHGVIEDREVERCMLDIQRDVPDPRSPLKVVT